jgi:hypothetical protein
VDRIANRRVDKTDDVEDDIEDNLREDEELEEPRYNDPDVKSKGSIGSA